MENYVGKRLDGRYEIIEIIGVGGMAVVYKAFDNIDNRIVAVKILKDEFLTNEEFRRRFKNESKAIAVLSHPNIVKVFDVSYGDRIQYIVMEYVEGITLKEYIEQQGKIDPREAVYFLAQILRALQHAHDKGIVHRDIKPQNILLISDGTIKVTDFGIARFSRSETRTMTDSAIGSVHYISPEQAKGGVTDAKADLYSVGVVLYEMLTGRLPFQSDNAVSVALMQLQNDPISPREINPDIPVGLEQIIIRAMQKNPADRYQSASEILMDIEAYKKNPNIKFNYSYYVDKQPTRYIQPQNVEPTPVPVQTEPDVVEPVEDEDYYGDESEFDSKSKKKTIAILSGVLIALGICAIVIIALITPNSNKISVPNLVGINYNQVNIEEEYSDFKFNPQYDPQSDEADGYIFKQEPDNGKKVEKGSVITIYISGNGTTTEVPDVYGYDYASAELLLKEKSFTVKREIVEDSEKAEGTVVRTSPSRGEEATIGSEITVYVAGTQSKEPVDVPNLIGKTLSEAKEALEEANLELDEEKTEYRSSSEPEGTVIGNSNIGEQVEPGTKIAVYVSTGVLPTETTTEESTSETTTEESTTETTTKATTTTKAVVTTESTTKIVEPSTSESQPTQNVESSSSEAQTSESEKETSASKDTTLPKIEE